MSLHFHHMLQEPVRGYNQVLHLFRPFTGFGIGIVVMRHEFAVWVA